MRPLYALVALAPLSAASDALGWSWPPAAVLGIAALALTGLAEVFGDAVEDLAVRAGRVRGGLLTAIFGSAPELCIAGLAVHAGLLDLAKATITGSILGNLLLVLGLSLFLGGLRHGSQFFGREEASIASTLLMLSVIALIVPALYGTLVPQRNTGPMEILSESVAAMMILIYALAVYHSLVWSPDEQTITGVHRDTARWRPGTALGAMIGSGIGLVLIGHIFVASVPAAVATTPLTEYFAGVVIIPLAVNVPGHLVGVEAGWRGRADRALEVAMGASIHVALFVAPALVFFSVIAGRPMDLVFSRLELAALGAAAVVATLVAHDGRSNWLEGAMLMIVYAIFALAFFWWPHPLPMP